jgi:hypothetical protein
MWLKREKGMGGRKRYTTLDEKGQDEGKKSRVPVD